MKIRNGFVSNSSSSSFIILLPDNFDINTIDFESTSEKCKNRGTTPENVKKAIDYLLKRHEMYFDDFYLEEDIVCDIFKEYIIGSIDTGPDDGSISLADNNKVKKILGL